MTAFSKSGFWRAYTLLLSLGTITQSAHADPLGSGTGAVFRLSAATYQEGCFAPCMCPLLMEQPVLGTMKFVYLGFANAEHSYAVEDVNWISQGINTDLRIFGFGKYRIGTPGPMTVLQHRLELDLHVGDEPSVHFDSGWKPYPNSTGIDIETSMNGVFCWDRVIHVNAHQVSAPDYQRYNLDVGSTFQRGCIDGMCDCAVGPELPLQGTFALVPLQDNSLFRLFSVVEVHWRAMNANAADGIPVEGLGLYWVGGEFAVQNRLALELKVAGEDHQHYDSGMVVGGGMFPLIDIVTRTHTNCVNTLLHVIAVPASGSGDVCGGIMGIPCDAGEFCLLEPGHCCCDFQGVCSPVAQACPEYYDPVCGCDAVTYSNPCFAAMAGQSIDYWGACRTFCGPNAQVCPNAEFCKFPTGSCGTSGEPGLCTPRPGGCPDVWDPVCGCDGITYGNECDADAAGVSIRYSGVCEDPCQPTPDSFGCTSCNSVVPEDVCRPAILHLDIHKGAITTTDCDCMNMSDCHIEFGNASPFALGNCPEGETCEVVRHDGDNDGVDDTFAARCMSSLAGPCCLDIDDGPVRYDTCLSRTQAVCEAEGGIFAGTNAGCDATQSCCFDDASLCAELHPVCCIASNGRPGGPGSGCASGCGEVCGGIAGIPCENSNEYCKLPIGQCCCDHFGLCTPTGGSCPAEWNPVCGCDGLTYGNECEADAAGVSIAYRGACGQPHCPATRVLTYPNSHPCEDPTNLVRVLLSPPNSASAVAVEEIPPAGWAVSNISHAGQYDTVHQKVKWGPFFPPFPTELSYNTARTSDSNQSPCFSGTISIDGVNETTCGETCLEICCPQMSADQPHDSCGVCPVTDCNSCDASVCGDSRIHMCEIVGYACAWLHGCHDDLAGMTRAAFIWRTGECYCWDDAANNWYPTDCSTPPVDGCCDNADRILEIVGESIATLSVANASRSAKSAQLERRGWIDIESPSTATAVALEIVVPKGWTISQVSDGGVWDAKERKLRWGVFFEDLSRTLTFTAQGPKLMTTYRKSLSDASSPGRWQGVISVDGINYPLRVEP